MRKSICLAVLLLAGCSIHFGTMRASYVDAIAGNTCVTTLGRDRMGVASYRNGELRGVEAGFEPSAPWVRDWADGRELVDHPDLPAWREQLARMRAAAADPGEDPSALAAACRGFPFGEACGDVCRDWVRGEPRRAGILLDAAATADFSHATVAEFTRLALAEPCADERLARWFAGFAAADHRDAALHLVRSGPLGPETGRAVLRELDEFPSSVRAELYAAAASPLVGDATAANTIQAASTDLPSLARSDAAVALLRSDGCSRELAVQFLRELDAFRSADRDSVFAAAAAVLQGDALAGADVAGAIDELPYEQRFAVVRTVLAQPGGAAFIADVLRVIDDLPPRDRVALLEQILATEPWDPALGNRFRAAVRDVVRSGDRERLLRDLEGRERNATIR